jgi:hypothetical protein
LAICSAALRGYSVMNGAPSISIASNCSSAPSKTESPVLFVKSATSTGTGSIAAAATGARP